MVEVTLVLFLSLFLIIIFSIIVKFRFKQNVMKEVQELFYRHVDNKHQMILQSDLEGLPFCVQKWLLQAEVVGKEKIRCARLKQKAMMRMREGKPWMPTEVEQYFTVDKPGFIWKAHIKAAPLFHIAGRDRYDEGKGNMLIKLLTWIKVADATGEEIDQGTLLRFLAEIMWFPTAALSSYIKWEEIDSHAAKATMTYRGVCASGVFTFNETGEVISFGAKRYMEAKGKYSLEDWLVRIEESKKFQGVNIPFKGEVIWKLKTGDFCWYQFEISEIEYNKAEVY